MCWNHCAKNVIKHENELKLRSRVILSNLVGRSIGDFRISFSITSKASIQHRSLRLVCYWRPAWHIYLVLPPIQFQTNTFTLFTPSTLPNKKSTPNQNIRLCIFHQSFQIKKQNTKIKFHNFCSTLESLETVAIEIWRNENENGSTNQFCSYINVNVNFKN